MSSAAVVTGALSVKIIHEIYETAMDISLPQTFLINSSGSLGLYGLEASGI